jgi:hypothetical protein
MLAMHLNSRGKRDVTSEKLELWLHLACEFKDFSESPIGQQFRESGGMHAMNYVL